MCSSDLFPSHDMYLMDFYKPDKHKREFLLYEVILNAYKIVAPQIKSHKITLSLRVDESMMLYGSPGELQQVILNLMTNAKDAFVMAKVENRQLSIGTKEDGESIVVYIEDNAGGINESLHQRIFEPYFTTKSEMGGTGIGLYMCSMIMKQSFGGDIS